MKSVCEIYYQLPLSYLTSTAANDLSIEHIVLNYQKGVSIKNTITHIHSGWCCTIHESIKNNWNKTHDQVVSTHALYSGPQFSTQVESQLSWLRGFYDFLQSLQTNTSIL